MNKRKTLLLALSACIIAILAVGGTLAYFTSTETVTNTFTAGDVKITLTESEVTADPTKASTTPEANAHGYFDADGEERTITNGQTQDYSTLLPGATVHKDPMVTNTGTNDAYIRVKVTHNNVAGMKKQADNYFAQLADVLKACATAHTYSVTEDTASDKATHVLLFTAPLAAEGTIEIFNSIPVPTAYDNTEMDEVFGDLEIVITAEAIQSTGFADAATAFVAFDAQV